MRERLLLLTVVLGATLTIVPVATAAKRGTPFLGPSLPSLRSLQASGFKAPLLVQFKHGERGAAAAASAQFAGAQLVSRRLHIWLLPADTTRNILPSLIEQRGVVGVQRNHSLRPNRISAFSDPLWQYEWWRAAVGADTLTAPAPGVPITVLDSGVDLSHPEFQGANIIPLNQQVLTDQGYESHGTEVASVAAAPANGVGIVGIYPGANVWSYDIRDFTDASIITGIDTAVRRGKSVINMSFGGTQYDPMLDEAIMMAFGAGSIVVAAAGNEFADGNPIEYPASENHVLTVAATNAKGESSYFSNASDAVDVAAPGEDITLAMPLSLNPSAWGTGAGTSYSAPIAAAATAWTWSVRSNLDQTQIFDLMRWSAHDIGKPDFDADTGWGLVDLPAALTQEAPPPDPQEPNEDIFMVKANGLFAKPVPGLTNPAHGQAKLLARLDYTEDPEDVYRVWIPAHRTATIRLLGDADVDLELWRPGTKTVLARGLARRHDLIGSSIHPGKGEGMMVRNGTKRGGYVYADVFLGKQVGSANYMLSIATSRK